MTVLEKFGELVAKGEPNKAELERAQTHFTDLIGAMIAGRRTEEAERIASLGATRDRRRPRDDSALDGLVRRAAAARSSEIDDIHLGSCATMGAIVVPTLLACANESGEADRLAAALCCGYETAIRLGVAMDGARLLYRGVWPTYFLAPLAAAATASRAWGLSPRACASALGLALTRAPVSVGAPPDHVARFLGAGFASRVGVEATIAAADGVRADLTLLDGDWLNRVHGVAVGAIETGDGFAKMTTLSLKPYCAAKQTIAAIDGFRALLQGGVGAQDVARVTAFVPPLFMKMIGHGNCATRSGRITSLPYQLALAALRPDLLMDVARTDLSADPEIRDFMQRVAVVEDDALMRDFPERWPARVVIQRVAGASESIAVSAAEGDPGRALDGARVEAKFRQLVAPILGSDRAEAALDCCRAGLASSAAMESLNVKINSLFAPNGDERRTIP